MKEWIISNTHFGHEKIIGYCNRPFKNVGQMDETLVSRWTNRVKPGDIIYHLGDVGFTNGDFLQKVLGRLPGKKILVTGNHDKSAHRMMEFGFDFACQGIIVNVAGLSNCAVLLTHRPLMEKPKYTPKELPQGLSYVIHGHIHNTTPEQRRLLLHKQEIADIPDWNINASVEVINYEPVPLVWLIQKHCTKCKGLDKS